MAKNNRYMPGMELLNKLAQKKKSTEQGLQSIGRNIASWSKKRNEKGLKRAKEYMRTTGHYPG